MVHLQIIKFYTHKELATIIVENKENEDEWNQKSWENLLLKVILITVN